MSKVWAVDKDRLFHLIELLELVPTRPGIPSSEFIKISRQAPFTRFQISSETSGDFVLEGEGVWPCKEPWYVDRRLLFPFIQAAGNLNSKKDFEFSLNEKELVVRHGSRKATFNNQPAVSGYADLDGKLKDAVPLSLSKESLALIACARDCASGDPTTPELNCVFLVPSRAEKRLSIYASNTRLIYRAQNEEKDLPKDPLAMPLFLVEHLTSPHLKKVYCTKKEVVLAFDLGKIWQPTSKKAQKFPVKINEEYLDAGLTYPVAFSVGATSFASIVVRLGQYLAAVRRKDWVLKIRGRKGEVRLVLESAVPQTMFRETVTDGLKYLKADVELFWPLAMLLPVYDYYSKDTESRITVRLDPSGRSFVQSKHIQMIVPRKKA